ncbi:hypothetical protein NQ317_001274 [Molorchus minor]|uniref:Major facilitator superfamily (MFS) profile domain-containing protein n=1 Tax=Molorchus minor TaxID=1323400 RepID=A0ABQ9J0M6_9CUCU|nr:hypothetical protein NQ317_001274 [Molorchus minor]
MVVFTINLMVLQGGLKLSHIKKFGIFMRPSRITNFLDLLCCRYGLVFFNGYTVIDLRDILMMMSGASFSWSSPILPKLLNDTDTPFGRNISTEEGSWISSLVPLGCTFGPFIFAYMADKIGRKLTLLSLGIPFLVSYIILAFATTIELYYLARFLIGFAAGGTFMIMPNYSGEIADKSIRGALGSTLSIAVCIGLIISYALGPNVPSNISGPIRCYVGEECPHYYLSKGKRDVAKTELQRIRGGDRNGETEKEFLEIEAELSEEYEISISKTIMSKGLRKAFAISISLLIFQQFTGINFVYYYTQIIFQETGAALSAEACSIIIGVVQLLSSFITLFIIDRLASAVGMVLSEVLLATYICLKNLDVDLSSVSFLPILTLSAFIVTYNSGFGPLPWIMLGELFPTPVKVLVSSVVSCLTWFLSFLFTKYFDVFLQFGLAQTFFLFSGCCVLALFFSIFCVIETKGKSLKEIQDILQS